MKATKRALFFFIGLLTLGFSGWFFASNTPTYKLDENTLLNTPDMIIEQMTLREYDQNGTLANFASSPKILHIQAQNQHQIMSPHIIVHQNNDTPWDIQAKHAISLENGNEITFYEHVRINQRSNAAHGESHLETSEITYYPKKKLAITSKKVKFHQPPTTVEAIGLRADLLENRIQLLQAARGTHEPSKKG